MAGQTNALHRGRANHPIGWLAPGGSATMRPLRRTATAHRERMPMGTADPFRTLRSYVWAGTVLACALHPLGAQEPLPAMEGDGVATTLNELATEYGIEIIWDQGPYEDAYPGGRRVARDAAEWEIELYAPILAGAMSPASPRAAHRPRSTRERSRW